MGIGRHPAALPPGQRPLQLERQLLRLRRDLDLGADRGDLVAAADLDGDAAERQIDDALAGDVAVLVVAVDELGVVVLEPVRIDLAVVAARRQILPGLAVQVEPDGDRLPRALVDRRAAAPADSPAAIGAIRNAMIPLRPAHLPRQIDGHVPIGAGGNVEAAGGCAAYSTMTALVDCSGCTSGSAPAQRASS